jgi:hypothetical protein
MFQMLHLLGFLVFGVILLKTASTAPVGGTAPSSSAAPASSVAPASSAASASSAAPVDSAADIRDSARDTPVSRAAPLAKALPLTSSVTDPSSTLEEPASQTASAQTSFTCDICSRSLKTKSALIKHRVCLCRFELSKTLLIFEFKEVLAVEKLPEHQVNLL